MTISSHYVLLGALVVSLVGGTWTTGSRAAAAADAPDWSAVTWISDGKQPPTSDEGFYAEDPAPQFRKTFVMERTVQSASLHIVGLGFYEAHLNGTPLSDCALAPLWTPYGQRVLYDTYDVTARLVHGENVLAVTLGHGWYNPLPLRMWGRFNLREALTVGRPCLAAQLEIRYEDGAVERVQSDTSWKVADGPLLRTSVYLGEVYDARREMPGWQRAGFDDAAWRSAVRSDGPGGVLQPRVAPPVSVRTTWQAVTVTTPRAGVHVVDLGRNFAGLARFDLGRGEAGETVTFLYGELLHPDGTVNGLTGVCGQIKHPGMGGPGAPDVAQQVDVYIRRGSEDETYTPRFTWHGFRYVQVEGLTSPPQTSDITALALASAVPDACDFECSNALLNDVHRVCRQTFLSNLLGVQSDCPARERFGYGADIAATTEAFIFNFDMHTFYAKTVQDFADEAADGWFTETAPYVGIADRGFGGRSGPIGWALVVPVMMRDLYRYYGDRDVLARHYDACVRYVLLVQEACPELIVPQCIGDHEALEKAPENLTATAHFHQWARLVAEFAAILGKSDDARKFGDLADAIRVAFQQRFVRGGKVGEGRQGEQVFGLYHDLIPAADRGEALAILQSDLAAKDGALTTGIFGTKYLLEVLSTEGAADVAGRVVNRRTFPGWGYMLDNNATTLWETWQASDNVFSQNHPMFGSVEEWFMKHVLGVSPAADAVGFDKIIIRPQAVAGVTWARGTYQSVRGPVRVAWRLSDAQMQLSIELPVGVTAQVWLAGEEKWIEVGAGKHAW
ncbi:MAG: family 78 glycoside hydrolase catalytic domain [Pirellulaceae bacterium]